MESVVENSVVVLLEGVEVVSKRPGEKDGILRDDGDARSKRREVDVLRVESVDDHFALRRNHSKKSESEGTFAGCRR